jgi:2-oxoglutarate ferredoxin oxidoreductase subunit delta
MKYRVLVDEARCKACELCVVVCPAGILRLGSALNRKGYHPAEVTRQEDCTGCRACALICPDVAIEIDRAVDPALSKKRERA